MSPEVLQNQWIDIRSRYEAMARNSKATIRHANTDVQQDAQKLTAKSFPPDLKEAAIQMFMDLTRADRSMALKFLSSHDYNLEIAVNYYLRDHPTTMGR